MDHVYDVLRKNHYELSFYEGEKNLEFLAKTSHTYELSLEKRTIKATFYATLELLEWLDTKKLGDTFTHTYKLYSKDASVVFTIFSGTVTLKDKKFTSDSSWRDDPNPLWIELVFLFSESIIEFPHC